MLIGNYSVLNRNPLRYLGGGTATPECNHHGALLRGGARKNRQYVDQTTAANKQFSLPYGSYPNYATLLPQKGGDLSARRSGDFAISGSATGGLGMPGEGTASFSITTNTPDGQLIVSGSGSASFVIETNNPLLTASINGVGSASFVIDTNTPILGAEANLVGESVFTITTNSPTMYPLDDSSPLRTATASFEFSGTLNRYAIGIMEGTTNVSDVVTNASVANAVWQSLVAEYAESGTMGNALATASSGGVDPSILAAAILAAAQVSPIHADIQKVNSYDVTGDGQTGTEWGPA